MRRRTIVAPEAPGCSRRQLGATIGRSSKPTEESHDALLHVRADLRHVDVHRAVTPLDLMHGAALEGKVVTVRVVK